MEILLEKNELLDLGKAPKDTTLLCLSGQCWLTLSGDRRDHILHAGGHFRIYRKGQLVVTAMANCRLKLIAEPKAVNVNSPWHPLVCDN